MHSSVIIDCKEMILTYGYVLERVDAEPACDEPYIFHEAAFPRLWLCSDQLDLQHFFLGSTDRIDIDQILRA